MIQARWGPERGSQRRTDRRAAEARARAARGDRAAQSAGQRTREAVQYENSRNSSKPPSSDGPGVDRKKPAASGRKRGGQPGHEGTTRALMPVESMNEVKQFVPSRCHRCRESLSGVDSTPWRYQVTELPKIELHRTEYQSHALACPCGAVTREPLPEAVVGSAFGPRLNSNCRDADRTVPPVEADGADAPAGPRGHRARRRQRLSAQADT